MLLRETGGPCTSMRCMTERCQAGSMTFKACAVQALECNAQGRKVARGKKKGRRTALYFRLIRPASGLHAHDMQAQGMAPSWRDAVSRLLQEHRLLAHFIMVTASPCVFVIILSLQLGLMAARAREGAECTAACMQRLWH